jgi:hypothetical protein
VIILLFPFLFLRDSKQFFEWFVNP